MQFIENMYSTNLPLAAILTTLFCFVDVVIILDLVRVCRRLYLKADKQLLPQPESSGNSLKSKLRWALSLYALGLGAVGFYLFYFLIWNHTLPTNGIGWLYVVIFVLAFITLMLLAFLVLNRIRIKYSSKKALIVNIVLDTGLFLLLNWLYFYCF